MTQINASIVLYHNNKEQLLKAIKSFLGTSLVVRLYLVDNSSNDNLRELIDLDDRIEYIFNNANLGYGSAHNIAIKKSIENGVPYHLVLNPDIYFESGVLEKLYEYMECNSDVGQLMPKVLYPDGELQYLCKLLPTPTDLIFRRFIPFKKLRKIHDYHFELHYTNYDKAMNVPFLSGCFMFFRVSALQHIGLFDERFFMYGEDIDITRRMHRVYKTMFIPDVQIVHAHARESYKNIKMLKIHIVNIIKYFNKWGWFFDKERKDVNDRIQQELRNNIIQPPRTSPCSG